MNSNFKSLGFGRSGVCTSARLHRCSSLRAMAYRLLPGTKITGAGANELPGALVLFPLRRHCGCSGDLPRHASGSQRVRRLCVLLFFVCAIEIGPRLSTARSARRVNRSVVPCTRYAPAPAAASLKNGHPKPSTHPLSTDSAPRQSAAVPLLTTFHPEQQCRANSTANARMRRIVRTALSHWKRERDGGITPQHITRAYRRKGWPWPIARADFGRSASHCHLVVPGAGGDAVTVATAGR